MTSGRSASANKALRLIGSLLLLAALLGGCRPQPAPVVPGATAASLQTVLDHRSLQDGDLVFRRGRDLMSALVLRQGTASRFSHVGMVLRDGAQVHIIHAMPDEPGSPGGVRRESLASFLAPAVASDAAAYRLPGVDRVAMRQWLAAQQGKPFDMRFVLSDASALYCTELVLRALQAGGQQPAPATVIAPLLDEPVVTPDALRLMPGLQPLAGHEPRPAVPAMPVQPGSG